jgi:hypothetical protein
MGDVNVKSKYPSWTRSWEDKLPEIDSQLVDIYYDKPEQTAQALDEAKQTIQYWFDNQNLEPQTRTEWEKLKLDGELFREQVQSRITQLIQDGKLRLSRTMGQGSQG